MRHERTIMWISVAMSVMMVLGAAGLYMTQHISILFVCLLLGHWKELYHNYAVFQLKKHPLSFFVITSVNSFTDRFPRKLSG